MHDGGVYNAPSPYAPGASFANVYKVPDDSDCPQKLEKVAFSCMEAGQYELQIYANPTDEADPTSGTPLLSEPVQGCPEAPLFSFVELPEPVILNPGDIYIKSCLLSAIVLPYIRITRLILAM